MFLKLYEGEFYIIISDVVYNKHFKNQFNITKSILNHIKLLKELLHSIMGSG